MINTKQLRCTVGFLGMLLPLIVLVLSIVYDYGLPDSISATYYIPTCITPFMIILGSASILLFSYRGYDRQDAIVCSIAGAFALGICLFPCDTEDLIERWSDLESLKLVGTFQLTPTVSGIIHIVCAIGFFALLAYNSLFLFTKSGGEMTPNKKKRNVLFRVCGIGMFISFIAIVPISVLELWGGVWAVETVALILFGVSWLTKANVFRVLYKD